MEGDNIFRYRNVDIKDAMMIAASIIYSGSGEFPYEVEFLGGTIKTEAATISSIRIKRKITGKMQQIA